MFCSHFRRKKRTPHFQKISKLSLTSENSVTWTSTPSVWYLSFWLVGQTPRPQVESWRLRWLGNVMWNLEPKIFWVTFLIFIYLQKKQNRYEWYSIFSNIYLNRLNLMQYHWNCLTCFLWTCNQILLLLQH